MNKVLALLLLLCIVAFANAKVLDLTQKNFNKEVVNAPNTMALVMMKASWCGHCKAAAPQFSAAEKEFVKFYSPKEDGDVQFKFVTVECPDNQQLCGQYGVQGYPTFKFFNNGKATDYNGGRDKADFLNFAKNKISAVKPAPKPVELTTQAQLDKCLKAQVCVYAVLPSELDAEVKEIKEYKDILVTAAKKTKQYDIQWIFSTIRTHREFDKALNLGQNGVPAITLLNARKSIQAPLYRAFTLDNIVSWASSAGAGRVSQAQPYKNLPTIGASKDEL